MEIFFYDLVDSLNDITTNKLNMNLSSLLSSLEADVGYDGN